MGIANSKKINSDEVQLRNISPKALKKLERERKKKEKELRKKNGSKKFTNMKQPIAPQPIRNTLRSQKIKFEESDYDQMAKERMQIQLAESTPTFIINQLMASIQFFGNYERETSAAEDINRKLENIKTGRMERHCKSVILPDRLFDTFDKRFKFHARHGPNKGFSVPLHSQTMYIVHDNIEITHPGDSAIYSTVLEASNYKMEIDVDTFIGKTKKKHIGYIKLKTLETIRKHVPPVSKDFYGVRTDDDDDDDDDDDNDENDDDDDNNNNSNDDDEDDDDDDYYKQKITGRPKFRDSIMIFSNPKKKGKPQRYPSQTPSSPGSRPNSMTPSPPSSEYSDYIYITALNSHQPLSLMRASSSSDIPINTTTLPETCFFNIRVPTTANPEHSDYESDEEYHEIKQSFNSKAFLSYFINMFQDTLAFDLGFTKDDLDRATWKGAVIYIAPWEIIPAIHCPTWPAEAFEWLHRARPVDINPLSKIKYQWPSSAMINKVIGFGCNVVPIGYTSRRSNINPEREFEWKIVFPKAERFLEGYLSSAQVKVYIVAKALIKTFVEPYLDKNVNIFTNEHLRAHLFWQCEGNFLAWSEESLGESLLKFLNSLLARISCQKLPDYFLPKRNLFENIPETILVQLHKRILRVTENLVMHLLIALRNLKPPQQFYPKFKFKKLYSSMIIADALTLINPMLGSNGDAELGMQESDDDNTTAMGAMAEFEKKEKSDKTRRRKTRLVQFQVQEKLRKKPASRKVSTESIDTLYNVMPHMDIIRRKIIYELFINHYLDMAKVSHNFKAQNQGLVYLKQAERLCSLLQDDNGGEEAREFVKRINPIRNDINSAILRLSFGGPALPRRESMLEPENKLRVRVAVKRQKSIIEEHDAYSNIEIIKSEAIAPSEFYSDDETNTQPPIRRKSIAKIMMDQRKEQQQLQQQQQSYKIIVEPQIHSFSEENNNNNNKNNIYSNNYNNDIKKWGNVYGTVEEYQIKKVSLQKNDELKSIDNLLENVMINKENNEETVIIENGHVDTDDEEEYDTSF